MAAVTTNKAVLFLLGGVAAAGAVAYGAGVFGPSQPETIAALPETGGAGQKDARLPESPAAALQMPAKPSESEAAAPAEPATPPGEPATLPAEAAAPAQPEVVPPSFDVVRVEGDGSIVIAGKAAAGAKVDLLVGSKVIGSALAGTDGDFAVVLDDPLKPGDYQIVLRATAPDNVVAMSVETAVVSVPETPEGQVLALVEEPGKPSQMITLPEPQPPAAAAKPTQGSETPAPAAPAAETKPDGEKQAALPEQTKPAPAQATPQTAGPTVRVEAVEIDGRKIFVAGAADPGRTVRGYANEILLGDAKASPDGRFLIEADRDLPVGDYIIRVDALEPDGDKVAARAAVPFEREPGQTIAAVAPIAPEPAAPGAQGTAAPPAAKATQPPAAAEAPAAAAQPPATATPPAAEAPSATAGAPQAEAPAEQAAPSAGAPASEQPAAKAGAPAASPPAVAETPAAGSQAPDAPAAGETAPPAAAESEHDIAAASQPSPGLPAPPPAGVDEVLAPKLKTVDSAVIIRRGDSLWRISRRVYGRGVRYSTIYLANEDQIEDPDEIWPGQIFKVPEKSNDGQADADYSTLGDSLTTMPKDGDGATEPAQTRQ